VSGAGPAFTMPFELIVNPDIETRAVFGDRQVNAQVGKNQQDWLGYPRVVVECASAERNRKKLACGIDFRRFAAFQLHPEYADVPGAVDYLNLVVKAGIVGTIERTFTPTVGPVGREALLRSLTDALRFTFQRIILL
jgi:hypothetical protein